MEDNNILSQTVYQLTYYANLKIILTSFKLTSFFFLFFFSFSFFEILLNIIKRLYVKK